MHICYAPAFVVVQDCAEASSVIWHHHVLHDSVQALRQDVPMHSDIGLRNIIAQHSKLTNLMYTTSLYADPSERLRGAKKTYICLSDGPTTIDVGLTASELLWWLRRGLWRRDAVSTQRYEHTQGIHEFLVAQVMCRKGGGDKATIPGPFRSVSRPPAVYSLLLACKFQGSGQCVGGRYGSLVLRRVVGQSAIVHCFVHCPLKKNWV